MAILSSIISFLFKTREKAQEFFKRKIEYLTKNIEKVQPILQEKYRSKQGRKDKYTKMFFELVRKSYVRRAIRLSFLASPLVEWFRVSA